MSTFDRREFLRRAALGAAALGAGLSGRAQADPPARVDQRVLGRIGKSVSIYGLGLGSAFTAAFEQDPEGGVALLHHALERGITYWDTATAYGPSQALVGPGLKPVRDRVFMVSKSGARDRDGFRRQLEQSLRLLQTDRLDLYHMHNLGAREDLDAMERGCVAAARQARDEGLIGAFGVTGHSSAAILVEAIRRFDPDAVLTTFPASRPDQGRYETELLPLAVERKMAVISMKSFRGIQRSDLSAADRVSYSLSLPGVCCAIVGADSVAHVDELASLATGFQPLGAEQRDELSRRVRVAMTDADLPWLQAGYRDGAVV